jgi:transposase-like protein
LLKGSNAVELARANGISQYQLFQWRDRFLEAGKSELLVKRRKDPSDKEIGRMERKIGQLTLHVEILQEVACLKKRGGSIEWTIHSHGLPQIGCGGCPRVAPFDTVSFQEKESLS